MRVRHAYGYLMRVRRFVIELTAVGDALEELRLDELVSRLEARGVAGGLEDALVEAVPDPQPGLEVLVRALETEAALNELGVGAMTDQIVGYLVNRLRIEQCYAQHPEIDEQEIVAPLFGLGLPRTGSTALSFLLAQDPAPGRRLDFLMQELHREANTLGSKAAALELTQVSVSMKVLIEQMREQVQNIE